MERFKEALPYAKIAGFISAWDAWSSASALPGGNKATDIAREVKLASVALQASGAGICKTLQIHLDEVKWPGFDDPNLADVRRLRSWLETELGIKGNDSSKARS